MNEKFAKMYPVGRDQTVYNPGVKVYAVTSVLQAIDLSAVAEDIVVIQTSNALASAVNISGAQAGMTIILEYGGGAVANHVYTFIGATLSVGGATVCTANADDESVEIKMITAARGIVTSNIGAVVLS